jgi:6-phosphogluconolactonase (cycloisomerase 2 family)
MGQNQGRTPEPSCRLRLANSLSQLPLLLLLLLIISCGGDGSQSSTFNPGGQPPPTPTPAPQLQPSRFIFGVFGFEADGIFAGRIDANTGGVTLVQPSPFVDGLEQGNVLQVASDPRGRFLFVLGQAASSFGNQIGNSGIASLHIDSQTGALSAAPNSPIIFNSPSDGSEDWFFFDGLGRFLYQPREVSPVGFDVYTIDQNSGQLTKAAAPSPVTPLGGPSVGSPDGQFIFNSGGGSVRTLTVDASGQLTGGATVSTQGSGGAIALSPDGRFLFVANSKEGTVAVFSVANGVLSPVQGAPFSIQPGAAWLAITPDGKFMYELFRGNAVPQIDGYSLNSSTGLVTHIAGFTPVTGDAITIDRAARFAFVSDPDGSGKLITYRLDSSTGVFTDVSEANDPLTDLVSDLTTVP